MVYCLSFTATGEVSFAGWWGHQPGRPAVGGVVTAHMKQSSAAI